VFGTTNTPQGVTVRAVVVAGVDVPLTTFNFRGWSVDLSADLVTSLARSGIATIPVVAYASDGCVSLEPPLAVRIPSDAGVQLSDGATDAGTNASDGSAD
jgi:hypothetical protein